MKAARFHYFGKPLEVIEIDEVADPPPPGPGEVSLDVVLVPLNPGDMMMMQGRYGADRPALPSGVGVEGLGRITAVGSGVEALAPGDRVLLPPGHATWCERMTAPAALVTRLPEGGDPRQLCMLRANPASALLMLTTIVSLSPGDWVIQNAANSGVGQYVVQVAKELGLRTVNIVRRPRTVERLRTIGADAVLVDGPDLGKRIREAVAGADIRLGLDCVGGAATAQVARALAPGGTVVNYGALSGEPCHMSPRDVIFRDVVLRGFWRARWQRTAPADEIAAVTERLIGLSVAGKLDAHIEAEYPFARLREALHHAQQSDRDGKILLRMTE
jgi:trans-2-enoyl-CoA reductase